MIERWSHTASTVCAPLALSSRYHTRGRHTIDPSSGDGGSDTATTPRAPRTTLPLYPPHSPPTTTRACDRPKWVCLRVRTTDRVFLAPNLLRQINRETKSFPVSTTSTIVRFVRARPDRPSFSSAASRCRQRSFWYLFFAPSPHSHALSVAHSLLLFRSPPPSSSPSFYLSGLYLCVVRPIIVCVSLALVPELLRKWLRTARKPRPIGT